MDKNQNQTSFIPRRDVFVVPEHKPLGFRYSVLAIVAAALFIFSISASAGLYVYKKSLIKQVNTMNAQLVAERSSFEPEFINEIVRLSDKIEAAKSILVSHRSVAPLFSLLENETLQSVRLAGFKYSFEPQSGSGVVIEGEAKTFNSVALQSDVFNADKKFTKPVFSDLSVDDKGVIKFSFESSLAKDFLLYKSLLPANDTEENNSGSLEIDEVPSGDEILPPAP